MRRLILLSPLHGIPVLPISMIALGVVLANLLVLFQGSVRAQGQSTAVTPASATRTPIGPSAADDHYRIGPGDVLDVKVFGKPQFNREGVKVDPRGMIRLPLVKQEIRAACRGGNHERVERVYQRARGHSSD